MFRILHRFSTHRPAWLVLSLSALIFELTALYFQHVMHLAPCVYCIYQRCAIWGIFFAGLLGAACPTSLAVRLSAIALWGYSAYQGLQIALHHVDLQFHPSFLNICPTDVSFPSWLPLNQWMPSLFQSEGACGDLVWQFLSLEMSQWMVVIFSAYLIVGAFVLIAQAVKSKKA